MILLNVDGFFSPLREFIEGSVLPLLRANELNPFAAPSQPPSSSPPRALSSSSSILLMPSSLPTLTGGARRSRR